MHEPVVRLFVDDDLTVGAVCPRRAQGFDVGGGRVAVLASEDGQRRAHVGRALEWLAGLRVHPRVGHADHPVERDGTIEPTGRRCLEHLHAAHTEPHHPDLADVVVHDKEVGRKLEIGKLEIVVELAHVTHALVGSAAETTSTGTRRTARVHAPRSRAWRGAD